MASFLETQLRNAIHKGFQGRLLKGILRRATLSSTVDANGDPSRTYTNYNLEGFVDTFSVFQKATAGIPESDVKLLIIAGSLSIDPRKDDQVRFRGVWYQVRALGKDPAIATWELQSFQIADPT